MTSASAPTSASRRPACVKMSAAIAQQNINVPAGRLDRPDEEFTVRVLGEFTDLEDLRSLPVNLPGSDKSVRIRDLGEVLDTTEEARSGLMTKFGLSEKQAQAILDLRLHRLTGLEQDKILNEYKEILGKIKDLSNILSDPDKLLQVIRELYLEVSEAIGDERRTEIVQDHSDLSVEDLIPSEDVVVTLSHAGYAKAQPIEAYQSQKRGGRGRSATKVKDEDFIDQLFVANTHDTILCFSSRGKVYWLKVYQVPQASRGSRGKPIVNLLPLEDGERINAVLPVKDYAEDSFVFMATSGGTCNSTLTPDSTILTSRRSRRVGLASTSRSTSRWPVGVHASASTLPFSWSIGFPIGSPW